MTADMTAEFRNLIAEQREAGEGLIEAKRYALRRMTDRRRKFLVECLEGSHYGQVNLRDRYLRTQGELILLLTASV